MNRRFFTLLGIPFLIWFACFLIGPLVQILQLSFAERGLYGGVEWGLSLANHARALKFVYFSVFFQSFLLAGGTAIICLLVGVPMAWSLSRLSIEKKKWALMALMAPFFMNMIARVYALKTSLAFDGPIADGLRFFGVTDLMSLSQNQFLVYYALVVTYLPYLLFPVWIQLEKLDPHQFEAALDLGAGPHRAFWSVIWPQLRPAVGVGLILVWVPVMGEYVLPDLLGGARSMMIGNLITEQFLKARDWPFGAALALQVMLALTLVSLLIIAWSKSHPRSATSGGMK